jgi:hypothetical protein
VACSGSQNRSRLGGGGRSSRKGLVWPLFSLFSVLLPFFFFFVPFFSQ